MDSDNRQLLNLNDKKDPHIIPTRVKALNRKCTLRCLHIFILYLIILLLCLFLIIVTKENVEAQTRLLQLATTDKKAPLSLEKRRVWQDLKSDWPNTICFPCTDLSPNITWSETDTLFDINATCTPQLCCLKDVGNIRKLIYLMLNVHYTSISKNQSKIFPDDSGNVNKPERNVDNLKVGTVAGGHNKHAQETKNRTPSDGLQYWETRVDAAHLFINTSQLQNTKHGKIPWMTLDRYHSAMISSRLFYNETSCSLRIKEFGIYFVYSAITFKPQKSDTSETIYHTLSRRHHLLPKTGDELLMINRYGGEERSRGYYTSFLCGALWLRQDDQLSIKVSNHSYVYNFHYSNYFGIYKL